MPRLLRFAQIVAIAYGVAAMFGLARPLFDLAPAQASSMGGGSTLVAHSGNKVWDDTGQCYEFSEAGFIWLQHDLEYGGDIKFVRVAEGGSYVIDQADNLYKWNWGWEGWEFIASFNGTVSLEQQSWAKTKAMYR